MYRTRYKLACEGPISHREWGLSWMHHVNSKGLMTFNEVAIVTKKCNWNAKYSWLLAKTVFSTIFCETISSLHSDNPETAEILSHSHDQNQVTVERWGGWLRNKTSFFSACVIGAEDMGWDCSPSPPKNSDAVILLLIYTTALGAEWTVSAVEWRREERDCSPVPHPLPQSRRQKKRIFFSEPASSMLNGHLILVNRKEK